MSSPRPVTIYDIANATDVSASTVSRALRKEPTIARETRKRIVAKAEELGYRFNPFATSLRTSRTNNIGVIVPKLDHAEIAVAVGGIEKIVNAAGYNLFLSQSFKCEHKEKAAIDNMYRARVDGLIVFGLRDSGEENITRIFSRKQTPVVLVDSAAHAHVQNVSVDNYRAAYDMANHLYKMGGRSFAYVTPDDHHFPYVDRLRGFNDCLRDNNVAASQKLIIVDPTCEFDADFVDKLSILYPFPDAIFFSSDVSAHLAIPVLRSRDLRIPEDLLVAGFGNVDDSIVAESQLTTIRFSYLEIAQSAATSLLKRIENPQLQFTKQIVKHELIARRSTDSSQ